MKRVLLISNVPQPYRVPLFNEIDRQLKERGDELKVVFAAAGYSRRKFKLDFSEMKFAYEILKSKKMSFDNQEKTMFTYRGINRVISDYKPDRIIVAGYSLATIKIYLRSFFQKIEYIIWSESIDSPGRLDSSFRLFERKLLVRRASAFIASGLKAKEYLVSLGAPAERVFIGIDTVDTIFFSEETNKIRAALAKPEKMRLIYFGYLVPRKNVAKLIEIIEQLSLTRKDFVLDILGDGNERSALEKQVAEKKLNDVVKFHGFIQKEELPKYLAQSCCFLFQTDFDVWGMVLNEAMAAGLPVLSSINAAATFDLTIEGETGFAVDYNNKEDVIKKINFLLDNPERAAEMGKKSQQFIEEKVNIKVSADGFIQSLI